MAAFANLMGLIFGDKEIDKNKKEMLDRQIRADEQAKLAADQAYKQEALRRGSPTLPEEAQQLQQVAQMGDSALADLLRIKGRPSDREIDADIAAKKAQADNAGLNNFFRQQGLDLQRASLEQRAADRKTAEENKLSEQSDRAIERLQGKMIDPQQIANTLKDVEGMIGETAGVPGFNFDQYDAKNNKFNGKEIDLPGVSIPGMGRVSFYSGDAQKLDSAADKLFNIELKDRFGSAVTNNEMQRIKVEWASGKYNTEAQKLDALQRYKNALYKEMQNIQAGFDPQDVQTYKKRGGFLADDLLSAPRRTQSPAGVAPQTRSTPGGNPGNTSSAFPPRPGSGGSNPITDQLAQAKKFLATNPNHPQAEAIKTKIMKLEQASGQ